jgi:hypothetical protein
LPTRGFGVAAELNPAREQLHPYLPDPLDARLGRRDVVEGLASRVDQLHPCPVDTCQSDTDSPAVALHGIRHNTRTSAARSTLGQKSSEGSSAGMRSETAVRRRRTAVAAGQGNNSRVFAQVNRGIVGLAGLEPAASSLSGFCPRLVSPGLHRWPGRTTCRWGPLETVVNRSDPMGCGPNVDQAARWRMFMLPAIAALRG